MMLKRFLTALVSIVVIFFVLLEGRVALLLALTLLALLATVEYSNMNARKEGYRPAKTLYVVNVMMFLVTFLGIGLFEANFLYPSFFLSFLLLVFGALRKNPQDFVYKLKIELLGLFYIPFLLGHALLFKLPLFADSRPFILLWFILIVTWVMDIAAFFVGSYLGRRKLAVQISPNKTMEGAIGGLIFGTLAAYIFARWTQLPYGIFLPLGFFLSLTGQMGDLFESCLKRNLSCKDSGRFFPGHGGVLDRIDSLLFNIPFAYYYLSICLLIGSQL